MSSVSEGVATTATGGSGKRRNEKADVQERPSKRRRLGQASVLCMRELLRGAVRDGCISDEERIGLQNAVVLLSQVDGKQWVNFPDSQDELKDLTHQQLRKVRPFLDKVAEELKCAEAQIEGNGGSGDGDEHIDCLKLLAVPWADGITARELLACCEPDVELVCESRLPDKVIKIIPDKYMLRSRARELVNYYYIKRYNPSSASGPSSSSRRSAQQAGVAGAESLPALGVVGRVKGGIVCALKGGRSLMAAMAAPFAAAVWAISGWLLTIISAVVDMLPSSHEPLWPTLRFFAVALLQEQVKKFFDMLVLIARLRVLLCVANCNSYAGMALYPFVFIAQKLLGWNAGSRLLGCACDDTTNPSVMSILPVRFADALVTVATQILEACALALPASAPVSGMLLDYLTMIHPVMSFLFDLIFSFGIAEGLAMVVKAADERSQPKLVWMSMNVGRMLRHGDASPAASGGPPGSAAAAFFPGSAVQQLPSQAGASSSSAANPASSVGNAPAVAIPEWTEDGSWNLFD
eukprot:TRINITY_DN64271_c0_g1_i1.p1 TRINITY_DN64271_c0_g1~~TRINITY_DN64271_c0_g1_i1.p1  ORF type:complete len:522 (+),score=105.28 TRINITY_DN64271_c0_g1_i1:134-1699(+)